MDKIGPGATTLSLVPETTGPLQATLGALIVVARRVRLPAQPLRPAAARDARGSGRGAGGRDQRPPAAALGVHALGRAGGFAGGLLVHMLGSITTEQVYLELTFLTLAMLVVGGVTSLWGAVVGALAVSGLDSLLGNAEDGIGVGLRSTCRRHAARHPRRR